jgi:hypothetical protein
LSAAALIAATFILSLAVDPRGVVNKDWIARRAIVREVGRVVDDEREVGCLRVDMADLLPRRQLFALFLIGTPVLQSLSTATFTVISLYIYNLLILRIGSRWVLLLFALDRDSRRKWFRLSGGRKDIDALASKEPSREKENLKSKRHLLSA